MLLSVPAVACGLAQLATNSSESGLGRGRLNQLRLILGAEIRAQLASLVAVVAARLPA